MLASTSTINVLSAAGLVAAPAGLLLVAVGAARRVVLALAILTAAAGAALAAAAYIPVLRDHIFPRGRRPWSRAWPSIPLSGG